MLTSNFLGSLRTLLRHHSNLSSDCNLTHNSHFIPPPVHRIPHFTLLPSSLPHFQCTDMPQTRFQSIFSDDFAEFSFAETLYFDDFKCFEFIFGLNFTKFRSI